MNGNININIDNAPLSAESRGEQASLPKVGEGSDAVPTWAEVLGIMTDSAQREVHAPKEEKIEIVNDVNTEVVNLTELSEDGGDSAVMQRLKELYETNKLLDRADPLLKQDFSLWKSVTSATVTNIRSAAWLTMDDPTIFEQMIIGEKRKKESNYEFGYASVQKTPISAHAVSFVCAGLELSLEERKEKSINSLLSNASTDRTAKIPGFETNDVGKVSEQGMNNAGLPTELVPVIRRALFLMNSGAESNPQILDLVLEHISLSHRGRRGGDIQREQHAGRYITTSLYLLYLHQQVGIIDKPEFQTTVCKLRESLFSRYSEDEGREDLKDTLKERYGFRFLHDEDFWNLQPEEDAQEIEGIDILDFNIQSLESKSKIVRDSRSRRKFNRAESIISASLASSTAGDSEQRKNRMLKSVMQEKEKEDLEIRRGRMNESQFIRQAEHLIEKRMISATVNEPPPDIEKCRESLIRYLIRFQHHPDVSPSSTVFLDRLAQASNGNIDLSHDVYALDMGRLMEDPFLLASLKYFSNAANQVEFDRILQNGDEEELRKVEFLSRYMAYKVLNVVGTEKRGSPLLFRSSKEFPMDNLRGYLHGEIGTLFTSVRVDSEREKAFMLLGIRDLEERDESHFAIPEVEGVAEDIRKEEEQVVLQNAESVSNTMKENLTRTAGTVLEKYKRLEIAIAEFGRHKKRNAALAVTLLAASFMLVRPQYQDISQLKARMEVGPLSGIVEAIRSREVTSIYAGDVINDENFEEGDRLGFMPRQISLPGMQLRESTISPLFATEEDITVNYSDYEGLVLGRTVLAGEETVAPGGRELQDVIIVGNTEGNYIFKESPLNGIENVNPGPLEVYEVFTPMDNDRVKVLENISVPEYSLSEDFNQAKDLLRTLNPDSRLAKYYASLITNLEEARNNNLSNAQVSLLLEEELDRFVVEHVNNQFYTTDVGLSAPTFAEELSWNQDLGQECEVSAVLVSELFSPFGVVVGTAYGEGLFYHNGQAWTSHIGHVNNLVGLPDGRVMQLESTPTYVEGKTPPENIASQQYREPSTAEVLSNRILEVFDETSPNQNEVVIATTTMLALLGKYRNRLKKREEGEIVIGGDSLPQARNDLVVVPEKSGPAQIDIHNVETTLPVNLEGGEVPLRIRREDEYVDFSKYGSGSQYGRITDPSERTIEERGPGVRTQTINSILQLMKPLSDEYPEEGLDETTQALLYSALSLNDPELQRLSAVVGSVLDGRARNVPEEEQITEELFELGNTVQAWRLRLLRDDLMDRLNNIGAKNRRQILEEFMLESGWESNGGVATRA